MNKPPIPIIENIDEVVYAAASKPGAFNLDEWHFGEAHCWGGWIIHSAGEAGYALERWHVERGIFMWPVAAAAQEISVASGSRISKAAFFGNEEEVLTQMRQRAEASVSRRTAATSGGV